MGNEIKDFLLTTKEAAPLVGLTERGLEMTRFRGDGPPYFRVGKRIRYRREDILNWLENHRVDPAGQNTGGDDADA